MFTLTRVSADRTLIQEFPTERAAALQASYSIADNGHGSKAAAQRFAASLGKMPLDTPAGFGPYTFTIHRIGRPVLNDATVQQIQAAVESVPEGLTGLDPMPYGERRWNGAVWPDIQVDRYNFELERIGRHHAAGMDTSRLVDGLYNLAHGFDHYGTKA